MRRRRRARRSVAGAARRTLRVLLVSQVLAGAGLAAGVTVGALSVAGGLLALTLLPALLAARARDASSRCTGSDEAPAPA